MLQQEYLSLKTINAFDVESLSSEDIAYLKQRMNYQPQSFVKHDEGPLPLAIFDIASAAKYKLNQFYVFDAAKPYQQLRQSNWQNFKHAIVANDEITSVVQQAKLKSLEDLNAVQYSELAKALLAKRNYQDLLVVKAIQNSNDRQLIKKLLESNVSAEAHKLMAKQLNKFAAATQADILQSVVAQNKALASSALIQYAKLPSIVRSDSWLTKQLSDQYLGASAAKAIGIAQSTTALESAKAIVLDKHSNRTQVANALLALKFANNDFGKSELLQLVEQKQIPYQDMQAEVAKWLD